MKTIDPSFSFPVSDRLPPITMERVKFGYIGLSTKDRLDFVPDSVSWFFHVRKGSIEVLIENEPPIRVSEGGCFGIDGRLRFSIITGPLRSVSATRFESLEKREEVTDREIVILSGFAPLAANLLVSSFSTVVHVEPDEADAAAEWIPQLSDMVDRELAMPQPKIESQGILARLAEMMVIVLTRHMLDATSALRSKLPSTLKDVRIWRALSAFYRNPGSPWTVASLAQVAGMSRTAFAVRFHDLTGMAPLNCLTRLRMEIAQGMLAADNKPIKEIAEEVGYGTEAAFNRAFKRFAGASPGQWRKAHFSEGS